MKNTELHLEECKGLCNETIAWMLQELARKADQRSEDYLRDLIMNTYTESINKQQFSNPFSNPN